MTSAEIFLPDYVPVFWEQGQGCTFLSRVYLVKYITVCCTLLYSVYYTISTSKTPVENAFTPFSYNSARRGSRQFHFEHTHFVIWHSKRITWRVMQWVVNSRQRFALTMSSTFRRCGSVATASKRFERSSSPSKACLLSWESHPRPTHRSIPVSQILLFHPRFCMVLSMETEPMSSKTCAVILYCTHFYTKLCNVLIFVLNVVTFEHQLQLFIFFFQHTIKLVPKQGLQRELGGGGDTTSKPRASFFVSPLASLEDLCTTHDRGYVERYFQGRFTPVREKKTPHPRTMLVSRNYSAFPAISGWQKVDRREGSWIL